MTEVWLAQCKASGLDILITCTLRLGEEQDRLYAQGRTAPGHIVTNAKAGQSAHQYGMALDFVPLVFGKPDWSGTSQPWDYAIAIAQQCGLQSLRPMESAHLQHPFWRTLKDVQNA
jgi:peptidoglycan L-alanyl-D-glutamate endopeptidase CwlK